MRDVLQAFIAGVIPENTTRRIKNRLEGEADPLRALQILRDEIPGSVLKVQRRRRSERQKGRRKVILSAYLQANNPFGSRGGLSPFNCKNYIPKRG